MRYNVFLSVMSDNKLHFFFSFFLAGLLLWELPDVAGGKDLT